MARKAADNFKQHCARPLKDGTGLKSSWHDIPDYKGLQLTENVKARMDYYASLPSLEETRSWIPGSK